MKTEKNKNQEQVQLLKAQMLLKAAREAQIKKPSEEQKQPNRNEPEQNA